MSLFNPHCTISRVRLWAEGKNWREGRRRRWCNVARSCQTSLRSTIEAGKERPSHCVNTLRDYAAYLLPRLRSTLRALASRDCRDVTPARAFFTTNVLYPQMKWLNGLGVNLLGRSSGENAPQISTKRFLIRVTTNYEPFGTYFKDM